MLNAASTTLPPPKKISGYLMQQLWGNLSSHSLTAVDIRPPIMLAQVEIMADEKIWISEEIQRNKIQIREGSEIK